LCSFREGKDGEQDQNPKNPNVTRGIGMEAGDHSLREGERANQGESQEDEDEDGSGG
jgi:hypothetical protein